MITSHDDSRLLPLRPAPALAPRGDWTADAARLVRQSPLLETGLSLEGLQRAQRPRPPAAIFVGVGLCTRARASRAVPFDVLGMLLPAERLRRAIGARELVVLVADSHALINDLDPFQVRALARRWIDTLARLGDSVLPRLRVLRASQLHATPRYRDVLEEVRRRAPGGAHPYVLREVADIEHLRRELGGVLKVGWAICSCGDRGHDERFFDARHRAWVGSAVGFVYCKAGRALDDRRPRAAPYITTDPERRICLSPGEDVEAKLARASALGHASASTVRGVRKQLKMIARAYRELGHPLRGPVEQRTQTIIDEMLVPANGARRRARGRR